MLAASLMFQNLREDLRRVREIAPRSEAARWSALGALLRSPGLQAVSAYRFGHWLIGRPRWLRLLLTPAYCLWVGWVRIAWGIELDRSARIGAGLFIGHFGDIHIGGGVVLGRNATLSQGVTIGQADARSPVIGEDVYIAPGAKVFGAIRVGNNVKIGANAVVHGDLPDNAVVALSPGYVILSMRGNRRATTSGVPQ